MSCMKIFRLNQKGCYNLINAQNNQYIFEVDDQFIETTACLKIPSSNSVESFLVPWWLNIGSIFTYEIYIYIYYKLNIYLYRYNL